MKPKTKTKRETEKLWDRVQANRANHPDPKPPSPKQVDDLRAFADSLGLRVERTREHSFFEIYAGRSVNAILLESTLSLSGAFSFLLGFQSALDLQRWRAKTDEVFGERRSRCEP